MVLRSSKSGGFESMASPVSSLDSRRLEVLRWPLIVAVVFIHANNDRVGLPVPDGGPERWVHVLRWVLSEGGAATAVPLFFLMAGYLFFAGPPLDGPGYAAKLRRRVRTLLVPYLFWNVALALVLAVATHLPMARSFVPGQWAAFVREGPIAWCEALLGIGRPPVVYPLWFLRDLMIAVLLAPIGACVFRAGRAATWVGLGALGVPWFLHAWPLSIPSGAAMTFFFVGGAVGAHGKSLFALGQATPWLGLLYGPWLLFEALGGAGTWYPSVHQAGILLGILFVLGVAAWVETRPVWTVRLSGLAGSAFFLFAVHEPALTLVQRLGARVCPVEGPWMDLGLYFGSVALVVAAGTLLHGWLRRVAPRCTAWITGGRDGSRPAQPTKVSAS